MPPVGCETPRPRLTYLRRMATAQACASPGPAVSDEGWHATVLGGPVPNPAVHRRRAQFAAFVAAFALLDFVAVRAAFGGLRVVAFAAPVGLAVAVVARARRGTEWRYVG